MVGVTLQPMMETFFAQVRRMRVGKLKLVVPQLHSTPVTLSPELQVHSLNCPLRMEINLLNGVPQRLSPRPQLTLPRRA